MTRYISKLYVLTTLIVLPFVISGCDNDPDECEDDKITISTLKFGDCDSTYQETDNEHWRYELNGDKLTIIYNPTWVNCAIENISIKVEVLPNEIYILEKEIGAPIANCVCAKPFEYVIDELPDGVYTVNIYRNILSETGLTHSFQIRID